MRKFFFSLGLMSGTSGDGVDASIIQSDGDTEYKVILDKYFKYTPNIYNNIHTLKDEINDSRDFNSFENFFRSFALPILSLIFVKFS